MSSTLRVAVVGTRGQAERVAVPTIAASERTTLAGVLGSSPERTAAVADRLGVRAHPSLKALADDDGVDAVWLTAPNHLHASMATTLLRGGVDVLLEKPMAIDTGEAAALADVAATSAATLRVAYQHRFRPAHERLRRQVGSGELGEPRRLRVHRNWRFPYFDEPPGTEPSAWRSSPETSGGWAVNDLGCHLVDLALWLTGARSVTVLDAVFTREFPGVRNDTSAFLSLRMGEACVAGIECSNVLASPGSLVELYTHSGWARLTDSFSPSATSATSVEPDPVVTASGDPYLRMLDDFVGACLGEPSTGATAEEALLNVVAVQTARAGGRYLEDLP